MNLTVAKDNVLYISRFSSEVYVANCDQLYVV